MKTVIYTVKKGYTEIAEFDNLPEASKFFAMIVTGPNKKLEEVKGAGGEAYYWKTAMEFSLTSEEVDIYPDEKEAKFAVFNGTEGAK